jgi:hypothetical protein
LADPTLFDQRSKETAFVHALEPTSTPSAAEGTERIPMRSPQVRYAKYPLGCSAARRLCIQAGTLDTCKMPQRNGVNCEITVCKPEKEQPLN